jgi:phage-related holin
VLVGVDYMIDHMANIIGWEMAIHPVGVLAISYLIFSEAVSVLENLAELGVEVPLLSRAIKTFRDRIDMAQPKKESHK